MPIFDESTPGITHETSADADIYERIPNLNDLYRIMVSEECIRNLSEIMQFLCNRRVSDGAVLFHCTEGKDRTGVISMILLSLLHVPIETILNDYLITNTVCGKKSTRYYWLLLILKRNKQVAERVRDVFLAKEEYLLSAYTVKEYRIVPPDATEVLKNTGDNRLTIISCTDDGKYRQVVTAISSNN